MIPAGEAGHLADVADDCGGGHRAGPEQPGQAGPRRGDRGGGLLPGLADPGIHGAAEWLLRRWNYAAALAKIDQELVSRQAQDGRASRLFTERSDERSAGLQRAAAPLAGMLCSKITRNADIRSTEPNASVRIKLSSWEPPIGIEPMTYALRVRRSDRLS